MTRSNMKLSIERISEIQITPIKPVDGLVGFASFILDNNLYLGSIGIITRPKGGYRLVYPSKKVGLKNINIFYPINNNFAKEVELAVISSFENLMNKNNGRHDSNSINNG